MRLAKRLWLKTKATLVRYTLCLFWPVLTNTLYCHVFSLSLERRHNERVGVSTQRRFDFLPFVQVQTKENRKAPRHWSLWPVNSPHKGPVTRKMIPFDDVIMIQINLEDCDTSTQMKFSNVAGIFNERHEVNFTLNGVQVNATGRQAITTTNVINAAPHGVMKPQWGDRGK